MFGAARTVVAYGHYGRPVVAFPSEGGKAYDWQDNGMVGAVSDLLDAGRIKLYCVDSFDAISWSNQSLPLEERARQHGRYEAWILDDVVPFIVLSSVCDRPLVLLEMELMRVFTVRW